MKNLIRSFILCACFLLMFSNASFAQAVELSVASGYLRIDLDPSYAAYLAGIGVTMTYNKDSLEDRGFRAVSGDMNQVSGAGEVHCEGRMTFTSGSTKVELIGMVLDMTNPSFPTINAMVSVNGVYEGRKPVFSVVTALPFSLPLKAGKNISNLGLIKGQQFLKAFQLPKQLGSPLVGSFTINLTLKKPATD